MTYPLRQPMSEEGEGPGGSPLARDLTKRFDKEAESLEMYYLIGESVPLDPPLPLTWVAGVE